jgi:hypothetical protein
MIGKAVLNRRRRRPLFWLLLSVLSCAVIPFVWLWGAFSGGLDPEETCRLVKGQVFDDAYRTEHLREPSRAFPLHNKCNASYDLVPFWINPTLVCLALITVGSLIAAVVLTVARYRPRERPTAGPPDLAATAPQDAPPTDRPAPRG